MFESCFFWHKSWGKRFSPNLCLKNLHYHWETSRFYLIIGGILLQGKCTQGGLRICRILQDLIWILQFGDLSMTLCAERSFKEFLKWDLKGFGLQTVPDLYFRDKTAYLQVLMPCFVGRLRRCNPCLWLQFESPSDLSHMESPLECWVSRAMRDFLKLSFVGDSGEYAGISWRYTANGCC